MYVGVLVIPAGSVAASAYAAVTMAAVQHGRGTGKTDGRLAHNTFNHGPCDVLKRMPQFTNAPESWATIKAPADPCDDCLRGVCKRVHSPRCMCPI